MSCRAQIEQPPSPISSPFVSQQDLSSTLEPEYDFVEEPNPDYYCPVTLEILNDPLQTSCCGHHLSSSAAGRIAREKKPCPMCKQEGFTTHKDLYFKRLVNALKVYCTHKANGCKWVGELGSLTNHSNNCGKRPWECEHCGFKSNFEEGTKHTPICDKYPIQCPNQCEIGTVPRCDRDNHLLVCPLQLVECEYANIGCEAKVPRRDIVRHMTENAQNHLMCATLHNLKLTQDLHQKIEEKDKQITDLKKQLSEHETKMKKQLSDHETIIKKQLQQQSEDFETKLKNQTKDLVQAKEFDAKLQQQIKVLDTKLVQRTKEIENTKELIVQQTKKLDSKLEQQAEGLDIKLQKQTEVLDAKLNKDLDTKLALQTKVIETKVDTKLVQQTKEIETKVQQVQARDFNKLHQQSAELSKTLQKQQKEATKQAQDIHAKLQWLGEGAIDSSLGSLSTSVGRLLQHFVKHEFTLKGFKACQAAGEDGSWDSEQFYTHTKGYKLKLQIDTNGYGSAKDKYLSAHLCLIPGGYDAELQWPLEIRVILEMVNQRKNADHYIVKEGVKFAEAPTKTLFRKLGGSFQFFPLAELGFNAEKNTEYLRDDSIRFNLYVKIVHV